MENYIQIILIVFGAFVFGRSLSFVVMQSYLLSYRDKECIPRIVYQQKACDSLIIIYNAIVTFVGGWIFAHGISPIFNSCTSNVISITIPIILLLLFIIYALVRVIFNEAYDLAGYYKDMIHYRKAQEVVTEDNDHEVNFIRTYEKVVNNDKWSIFWMIFIILIMIFI